MFIVVLVSVTELQSRCSFVFPSLVWLRRYRFGLDEANFNVLRLHLCPEVFDVDDQVRGLFKWYSHTCAPL